jgi:siroheme synthase
MPGPDYDKTTRELIASGLDGDTPCVLVSNAGCSNQQQHLLTVSELGSLSRVAPPAILIVGNVVRHVPAQSAKYVAAALAAISKQTERPSAQ